MHIRTENLTKVFFKGKLNEVLAVKDISIKIKTGEFFAITGPSGSGKTTLLSLLCLLTTPTDGRIFFDNNEVSSYSDGWKTRFRKEHIGIIFQQYNLLPNYSAWENVALPLLCRDTSRTDGKRTAISLMKKFGLYRRIDFKVAHLSGGEQQRVAIARALVTDPRIVIADEPTASIDEETKRAILDMFKMMTEDGKTIILATHDKDLLDYAHNSIELAHIC